MTPNKSYNPLPQSTMNRREAIKKMTMTGGIVAAGAGLTSPLFSQMADQSSFSSNPKKKLGIALVGLGNYSTAMLGPSLLKSQYCELVAVVTGSPEKGQKWSDQYGFPKDCIYDYQSFDTIANNDKIDIVYVVLPNFMHAEYTIRAAKAGKHVICEKPMALTTQECNAMIRACRDANRKLSIGYRLRFDPFHNEAIRICREFDQLSMIETSLGFNYQNPESWRFKIKEGGGGAIMDLGVYCIQAARYLSGEEPVSVTAQSFNTNKTKFREIPEGYLFQLTFPSGVVSSHSVSYSSYIDRLYATARSDHKWVELDPTFQGGANAPVGNSYLGKMEIDRVSQVALQIDDFAQCILNDSPSIVNGEEGLADMKVITAIKRAAVENRSVMIS